MAWLGRLDCAEGWDLGASRTQPFLEGFLRTLGSSVLFWFVWVLISRDAWVCFGPVQASLLKGLLSATQSSF